MMQYAVGVAQQGILSTSLRPLFVRSFASGAALIMNRFGVPEDVLKLTHNNLSPLDPSTLGENEVLINILAVSGKIS